MSNEPVSLISLNKMLRKNKEEEKHKNVDNTELTNLVLNTSNYNKKEEKGTFEELNVSIEIIRALKRINIYYPSVIQYMIMKKLICKDKKEKKRNCIIQSRNGTGKSMSICIIIINQIFCKMKKKKETEQNNKNKKEEIGKIDYSKYVSDHISQSISDNENIFFGFLFFYGLILEPTRELCQQVYDNIKKITNILRNEDDEDIYDNKNGLDVYNNICTNRCEKKYVNYYKIKSLILYGGTDIFESIKTLFYNFPHIIISTPGRLKHVLNILNKVKIEINKEDKITNKGIYPLSYITIINICLNYFILDEIDALLDEQFDEQLKIIYNYIVNPKIQILCYSSTFQDACINNFIQKVIECDERYVARLQRVHMSNMDHTNYKDDGNDYLKMGLDNEQQHCGKENKMVDEYITDEHNINKNKNNVDINKNKNNVDINKNKNNVDINKNNGDINKNNVDINKNNGDINKNNDTHFITPPLQNHHLKIKKKKINKSKKKKKKKKNSNITINPNPK
ncbi:hypothetical protein PFMC_01969 [Plasmodium falciparum CAMP/Malaysia]|uniref:Helicase ATP-binding domain-containing protein n=1 Tax=Plasmodium falciparum (isolate Camp / Malaysia) TaxID=5835 RepID=A0A024X9M0_PLAFC|nr:hypothetical protein PFMC_01969 [Plasmodium falciparum CAMP/Malaysia]